MTAHVPLTFLRDVLWMATQLVLVFVKPAPTNQSQYKLLSVETFDNAWGYNNDIL